MREISLVVNGERRELEVPDHALLLDVLRERLGLTGTKEGCSVGACGTCTVLLDGRPVSSCLLLAAQLEPGQSILTVEGLSKDGRLDPVQEAFLETGAFQCAFCTPGMILSVKALLSENPSPTEEEAKEYLMGNYCRCGAHLEILAAVQRASRKLSHHKTEGRA